MGLVFALVVIASLWSVAFIGWGLLILGDDWRTAL